MASTSRARSTSSSDRRPRSSTTVRRSLPAERCLDHLGPLVADVRVEGRADRWRGQGVGAAALLVGLDAGDALVGEQPGSRRPAAGSTPAGCGRSPGSITLSSKLPAAPPKATAASLPMTWATTWETASGMTGLTLPGMIDDPGCRSGRRISASPDRGPRRHPAQVGGASCRATRRSSAAPRTPPPGRRARPAPRSGRGPRASGRPVPRARRLITPRANPLGALMPVPTAVPPRGSSADPGQDGLQPLDAELDGGGVAAELLAERDRRGVHQVGAPGLDHAVEGRGLLARAPRPGARGRG